MEKIIEEVRQRARKNFSKGFNCAECVLEAVLETIDTDLPKEALKLATGFGGGIGLFGDTCGAVAGAVMAVGSVHGRSELPDGDNTLKESSKQLYGNPGLYRLFNQIPNAINEKYGHTLCREITQKWADEWLCRDHALHCREIITDAAELAARLILADKDEICSKPFGDNVEGLKDRPADHEKKD